MASRHSLVVITGFMGTGKTSVGQVVARRLGRKFVDMDAVIEEREGKTISEIFAAKGEAYFRAVESELCRELAAKNDLVIATGGGTVVNPANHQLFASASIVCLDASKDVIVQRLATAKDRPMLEGASLLERVESLYDSRKSAYARIDWHVDTAGKSVAQVAEEIIQSIERVK